MSHLDQPDEGGGDMDLVLPFVATASHGGPYDDAAFVAGYATAQLDQILQLASAAMVTAVYANVRTVLVPQLDLVAMRWGYTAEASPAGPDPDWTAIAFTHTHGGELP
jgi:hypothetical protein